MIVSDAIRDNHLEDAAISHSNRRIYDQFETKDFSTNIAAFERAIVNNDVAEFNAMSPTFEKDIADYRKWKAEGKLSAADIGKVKRQADKINDLLAKAASINDSR